MVFRVCEGRITQNALLERLEDRGFQTEPVDGVSGFHKVVEGPGPLSATPEHWLGFLYVQQASTGVAAPAIAPKPGEHVLDLCSAPGGKTLHMAELMKDSGCLVASEVSEPRIRGLLGNVYRLGNSNILVTAGDGRDFPTGVTFDRVLVDAPCSGEGTLRRAGGRAPNQSMSFLSYVTKAQRELLERAVKVTRPGGVILYVTCTFAPEENEAVVTDALRRLPVEIEPLSLSIDYAPGLTHFEGVRFDPRLEGAARIYPHHLDSGGLFMARLRKLGDGGSRSVEDIVPRVFPDDSLSVDEANERLGSALEEFRSRYGLGSGLDRLRWIFRGGRAWFHTLDAWPVQGWESGSWRTVSVGIRGIDFDSRGRPRPSNDLLRLLGDGMTHRTVDVSDDEIRNLIAKKPIAVAEKERGPIGIRHRGDLLGRGALTVDGLKSEIPKARAADYLRSLS